MADFDDDGELTIGRVTHELRELARDHGVAIQMQKMVNDEVKRIMVRIVDAPGPRLDNLDQRVELLTRNLALTKMHRPAEPRLDGLDDRVDELERQVLINKMNHKLAKLKSTVTKAVAPAGEPSPPADQVYRGNATTDLLKKVEALENQLLSLKAEVSQQGVNMISLAEGLPGTGALRAEPKKNNRWSFWSWCKRRRFALHVFAVMSGMALGMLLARW